MPRILVKERGHETRNVPVTGQKLTVGRASNNTIVLKNRYASAIHCEISTNGTDCIIYDLDSTNGLFVNGFRVKTKKLEDGDKVLVGAALLIYIPDEEAISTNALLAQLKNGDSHEREIAADLLGHFGGPAVAKDLMKTLKDDPEAKVKAAAAEALGLLGNSRNAKALIGYFDTSELLLRNSVVRALIRLADDKVVDGVAHFLNHNEDRVRVLAANVLGQTRNGRATKYLVQALGQDSFAVREAAVKSLGDLRDPRALDALVKASRDPERFQQVWVVEALGKLNDAAAVPIIINTLENSNPEVREAAAEALGKLRTPDAVPRLIDLLEDDWPGVRKAAAASLEKISRYMEVEQRLSDSSSREMKTMEISLVGEQDEHSPGAPRFGENVSKWREWWSQRLSEDVSEKER